jgi:Na+/proline symporter
MPNASGSAAAFAAASSPQQRRTSVTASLKRLRYVCNCRTLGPNFFFMIIPGLIAIALLPELESPDHVFPALAFELLPVGLRGLILTALLAAIMSSLDSALNAAASLLTMDFVKPLRPEISGRRLLV